MKKFIEFLATGDVTWVKGDTQKPQHVRKGTHLIADKVARNPNGGIGFYEIWQGKWSSIISGRSILISDVPKSLLAKLG